MLNSDLTKELDSVKKNTNDDSFKLRGKDSGYFSESWCGSASPVSRVFRSRQLFSESSAPSGKIIRVRRVLYSDDNHYDSEDEEILSKQNDVQEHRLYKGILPVDEKPVSSEKYCDILKELQMMPRIIGLIWSMLEAKDLFAASWVSKSWRALCLNDKKAKLRRQTYLMKKREEFNERGKENKKCSSKTSSSNAGIIPLNNSQNIMTEKNISLKQDATSRHEKFLKASKNLPANGRLTPCIRCQNPSQVLPGMKYASCTNMKCSFRFCPGCWQQYKTSHMCPASSQTSQFYENQKNKTCNKKNLRRLLK